GDQGRERVDLEDRAAWVELRRAADAEGAERDRAGEGEEEHRAEAQRAPDPVLGVAARADARPAREAELAHEHRHRAERDERHRDQGVEAELRDPRGHGAASSPASGALAAGAGAARSPGSTSAMALRSSIRRRSSITDGSIRRRKVSG